MSLTISPPAAETFGYVGPCGRTYVTHNRDGWLVHYEDITIEPDVYYWLRDGQIEVAE